MDTNQLPLTSSIEQEVRQVFAVAPRESLMGDEALISALRSVPSITAMGLEHDLLQAGYEPCSAPAASILSWVDTTFEHWLTRYPLAPELSGEVTGLKALAAAFALTDQRFFVPGGHVLHKLLDSIHNGLVGWHDNLGSAGQKALNGVREAIEKAQEDFPSHAAVQGSLEAFAQRMNTHANQLTQLDSGLLNKELSALGPEAGEMTPALVLNDLLNAHQVPGSVARFIKSDWFESGKIIARESGIDSDAWRSFVNTSSLLVEAVQPVDTQDTDGQKRLQQAMQHLPSTLARQLRSLQPDNDAIAGAVGLIEYALLRNMRGEDLGLMHAEPISVRNMPTGGPPKNERLAELGIETGRWYLLHSADGDRRVRLAGSLLNNLYLVFMDFTGARVARKSFSEFSALLRSGEAIPLTVRDSFCQAMVEAIQKHRDSCPSTPQDAPQAATPRQSSASGSTQEIPIEADLSLDVDLLPEPEPHVAATWDTPNAGHPSDSAPAPRASSNPPREQELSQRQSIPTKDRPYDSQTVVKLQIPMGTWMGFHDRDPPLMARVAVRDLEKDSYIFTNREGIKLRELTVSQLIALIDKDMVDILERKSTLREGGFTLQQEQDRLN
jgi:hypothetical protein